jgi:hypothetical protein
MHSDNGELFFLLLCVALGQESEVVFTLISHFLRRVSDKNSLCCIHILHYLYFKLFYTIVFSKI